jgi:anti-sigma B factor antagonist
MKIDISQYRGNNVILPFGEIDMYSSPVLRKALMDFINKETPSLYIDFKEVSYIDSSGIATLVEGLKTMKAYGGRLKLVGIPEVIMEIFRFSKLDNIFEIYGNIDNAVNS